MIQDELTFKLSHVYPSEKLVKHRGPTIAASSLSFSQHFEPSRCTEITKAFATDEKSSATIYIDKDMGMF